MGRILASLLAAASLLSMALVGGIGLGLPRRRSRLGWLGAQLLHHRCQAVGAASMRALQPSATRIAPIGGECAGVAMSPTSPWLGALPPAFLTEE